MKASKNSFPIEFLFGPILILAILYQYLVPVLIALGIIGLVFVIVIYRDNIRRFFTPKK